MKKISIKVNNKEWPLSFGYGALRLLADRLNLRSLTALFKKFESLNKLNGADVSFETLDLLGEIILSGIVHKSNTKTAFPEVADIVEVLLQNPDQLTIIIEAFTASMPQVKEVGKDKPGAKGKK